MKVESVEILATVRHSTNARSGFEFYPLSAVAENAIQDWLRELEQEEFLLVPGAWKYLEN
jgi:hypothetical protein